MTKKIQSAFVMAVVMTAAACGGASATEDVVAGQSPLSQKKGEPTKPSGDDCSKANEPEQTGACFGGGDDSGTCKPADSYKLAATKECEAKGATLVDLRLGVSCGADSYQFSKFECCTGAPAPSDPPPPKEPGEPTEEACSYEAAHFTCQSEAAWKDHAFQVCAKQGLSLTHIAYGAHCGKNGEVEGIKFNCCK